MFNIFRDCNFTATELDRIRCIVFEYLLVEDLPRYRCLYQNIIEAIQEEKTRMTDEGKEVKWKDASGF